MAPLDGPVGWSRRLSPLDGTRWMVPVDGTGGWPRWMAPMDGPVGWSPEDGPRRMALPAVPVGWHPMDGPGGWPRWMAPAGWHPLDGPPRPTMARPGSPDPHGWHRPHGHTITLPPITAASPASAATSACHATSGHSSHPSIDKIPAPQGAAKSEMTPPRSPSQSPPQQRRP